MATGVTSKRNVLLDPDCVRCLRKKVSALGVVVFFKDGDGWRIGNFESDIPRDAAEAHVHSFLKAGLPAFVASKAEGLLLTNEAELKTQLPALAAFFSGHSIIGCAVNIAGTGGVRVAWRENTTPFKTEDLSTLRCFSQCPKDCGPGCSISE
jgi:hypothetical protein